MHSDRIRLTSVVRVFILQRKGKVQGAKCYPPRSLESDTYDSQLLKHVSDRKTIERSQFVTVTLQDSNSLQQLTKRTTAESAYSAIRG